MTSTEALRERVKEYVEHADTRSLKIVQAILEVEQKDDWWEDLPAEVQNMLNDAIKQDNEGEGISHEEMIQKHSKWFKK